MLLSCCWWWCSNCCWSQFYETVSAEIYG
jgi:hypothetical protein